MVSGLDFSGGSSAGYGAPPAPSYGAPSPAPAPSYNAPAPAPAPSYNSLAKSRKVKQCWVWTMFLVDTWLVNNDAILLK